MSNVSGRAARTDRFCNSRAFRHGWEDYRLGRSARFGEWGTHSIAYEMGRQVAAHTAASGIELRPLPTRSRVSQADLQWAVARAYAFLQEARV